MKKLISSLAVATSALCVIGSAHAEVLVNQPANSNNVASQSFSDFPSFTTFAFDDFTLTKNSSLTSLKAFGTETGNSGLNTSVTAEIWSGLPGSGSALASFSGTEDASGNLTFNLGGYQLGAGTYWLTGYVTRAFGSGGGQWFFDTSEPVTGAEAQFYNPGNGFGLGSAPIPVSRLGIPASNLAFTLEGSAVPEPASLALAGLGLASLGFVRRRKVGRAA